MNKEFSYESSGLLECCGILTSKQLKDVSKDRDALIFRVYSWRLFSTIMEYLILKWPMEEWEHFFLP